MTHSRAADLVVTPRERRAAWLLVGLGAVCVVGGGLASAATAMHPTEHTAWAVAYLVLVAGVAQVVLGAVHLVLAPPRGSAGAVLTELVCWNVGNAAVLAGVLVTDNALVDLGGALLVVALVLAVLGLRGASAAGASRMLLYGFRALVVLLLLSIPAGLLLAQLGV